MIIPQNPPRRNRCLRNLPDNTMQRRLTPPAGPRRALSLPDNCVPALERNAKTPEKWPHHCTGNTARAQNRSYDTRRNSLFLSGKGRAWSNIRPLLKCPNLSGPAQFQTRCSRSTKAGMCFFANRLSCLLHLPCMQLKTRPSRPYKGTKINQLNLKQKKYNTYKT